MTPSTGFTYRDVVDVDAPELERLMESGRRMLKANDVLMSCTVGHEFSIFNGCVVAALKVAIVNLGYAMQRQDWNLAAIAMAALEVSLTHAEKGLEDATPEELRTVCGSLCRNLQSMLDKLPAARQRETLHALETLARLGLP